MISTLVYPSAQRNHVHNGNGRQAVPHRGFRFDPVTSAEFDTANYQLEWLVRRLIVKNQPGVIGGPQKSLKTSIVVDLVLSLATGRPFLGAFDVERPVCTALLSGESGAFTLRETARRVCAAKGIALADANVLWSFDLPQLANPSDLDSLATGLREQGPEVVVIDPLYLCLLAGAGADGLSASNLYHLGPLFFGVARACLSAGVTPLLVHHTVKGSGKRGADGDELGLSDLAFAGIAEFARQWLLLWRRKAYSPGSGRHELSMSIGGSSGQSGRWALDIDEGVLGDDFSGRTWNVQVANSSEAQRREGDVRDERKRQEQDQRNKSDDDKLLKAIDSLAAKGSGPIVMSKARDIAGFNSAKMTRCVDRLEADNLVEVYAVEVATGASGKSKRPAQAIRRRPKREGVGTVGTVGTNLFPSGLSGQ